VNKENLLSGQTKMMDLIIRQKRNVILPLMSLLKDGEKEMIR
jgi:hypothetical protein